MDIGTIADKNILTIHDAYKTYDGKHNILRGLNMNVRQGTIYGLLGSSGCGKSTILNAIIGLLGLNSGTIELAIRNKCDVGFMPQSVSLYALLTIEESLSYYGTMSGMDPAVKRARIDLMFHVLQLPNRTLFPSELSGGQKRRVSLAIALLHDPKLLILDEPTVGVDPMLRNRIWEFLFDWIRSGGKTIIITTHYIDEARQANTIGLMRKGEMICENSPDLIMSQVETNNLEDAFLRLSQRHEEELVNKDVHKSVEISKKLVFSSLSRTSHTFTKSRFKEELRKNWVFIWRNLPVALTILMLPAAYLFTFNMTWGKYPEDISLAVVNDEIPAFKFCDNYIQPTNCSLEYLSCRYLLKLKQKTFVLVEYNTVEEALEHLKDTDAWGVLYFSADFTNALSKRIDDPLTDDSLVLDNSTIAAHMDYSNKIMYDKLSTDIIDSYYAMIKDVYASCNLSVHFFSLPIKFQKPIYGEFGLDLREFYGSSMLTTLMFSMPLIFGAIILVEEKSCGALSRSLVAGVSFFEILSAHTTIQISVHLFSTITSVVVLYGFLGFPIKQPIYCLLLLLFQGFVGMAFTFTVSTIMDSLVALACVVLGYVFLSILIGGILWPLEGMHWSLKPLSWLTPFTFSAQAYRSIAVRGWDITHMEVCLGFAVCLLWILLCSTFTFIYIKKNRANLFVSKYIH